ncbi:MAG: hypothetical protein WCW02_02710 [Candidatus Buchananbacteria bacterium]
MTAKKTTLQKEFLEKKVGEFTVTFTKKMIAPKNTRIPLTVSHGKRKNKTHITLGLIVAPRPGVFKQKILCGMIDEIIVTKKAEVSFIVAFAFIEQDGNIVNRQLPMRYDQLVAKQSRS